MGWGEAHMPQQDPRRPPQNIAGDPIVYRPSGPMPDDDIEFLAEVSGLPILRVRALIRLTERRLGVR